MKKLTSLISAVALVAIVIVPACSEPGAPVAKVLNTEPMALHSGGPDTLQFNSFAGELWVCPDVPEPVDGFIYRWSITDNATNQVVQSGVTHNVTAGTCLILASVPTSPPGHYTAWVREDPSARLKITRITATYGLDLPIPPPVPTLDINGKAISDLITNDYGVVFTFYHKK